jgi:hypothetical protein
VFFDFVREPVPVLSGVLTLCSTKVFQMLSLRHSWSALLLLSLVITVGCSDAPKTEEAAHDHEHGHDHDHGPATLKEALTELTSLRDTMRDAFAKNDADAAHDPLHEVGHVLEAIPELAKKEQVSAENQAAIESAVNTLMDAFGAVDKTMHGQEGSLYSEESEKIDAAITALAAACGPAEPPAFEIPATEPPATETPATEAPATETPAEPAAETEKPAES